ncbi:hypothetical protein Ping_1280 [Psychromonas ingrahamii 37]|uniref:Lipoprotein n=1 Tax=Psychromonas ingrahamii (strain DSM 17664 / CCUG 51855 / 37) TaxID=357804 RepID=A1SUE2_PSYIN|nr:hypothetical protein [Psychromonas ingrahamii]ABM03107.1 hypothetical protein Ping_1280 [Psychromonas ingrahamii 37]
MRFIKFGRCILIFSVLVGCVPNATVYYKPLVDVESTHEKSHCVPTEKYVNFIIKTKDQTLKVRGYGNTYSTSHGEVSEGQFVIYGNWNEINFKNEDFYITAPAINDKSKPIQIYGEVHDFDGYSSFNSGAVFPKQDGDSFDVIFPSLIIDGEEVKLPTLHIKRTVWIGISPFNC